MRRYWMLAGGAAALIIGGSAWAATGAAREGRTVDETAVAPTPHADVKVADDVRNGSGNFSGMDYGISERFQRAWLVLHYTHKGACQAADGECELDEPVAVSVRGLTYDPAARQVQYRAESAAPVVCANVVRHRFLGTWKTIDATGKCDFHVVKAGGLIDDGHAGRQDRREEIHFGVGG